MAKVQSALINKAPLIEHTSCRYILIELDLPPNLATLTEMGGVEIINFTVSISSDCE